MNVYDFTVKDSDGVEYPLAALNGSVVLIVNTATKCGFATQFAGLEKLYQDHKSEGFTVLGFPSDQFKQEPVSDDNMVGLCRNDFGVTFPIFAKIKVNGSQAEPLYDYLKKQKRGLLGGSVKWNFTKFLIDRKGNVIKRYSPSTEPYVIEADIIKALDESK